jgi:hypothetical protein
MKVPPVCEPDQQVMAMMARVGTEVTTRSQAYPERNVLRGLEDDVALSLQRSNIALLVLRLYLREHLVEAELAVLLLRAACERCSASRVGRHDAGSSGVCGLLRQGTLR